MHVSEKKIFFKEKNEQLQYIVIDSTYIKVIRKKEKEIGY